MIPGSREDLRARAASLLGAMRHADVEAQRFSAALLEALTTRTGSDHPALDMQLVETVGSILSHLEEVGRTLWLFLTTLGIVGRDREPLARRMIEALDAGKAAVEPLTPATRSLLDQAISRSTTKAKEA